MILVVPWQEGDCVVSGEDLYGLLGNECAVGCDGEGERAAFHLAADLKEMTAACLLNPCLEELVPLI